MGRRLAGVKNFAVAAFVVASTVAAQWVGAMNGNDLKYWSDAYRHGLDRELSDNEAIAAGNFLGYLEGVFDSSVLVPTLIFCEPNGLTLGEASVVVMKYLDDHPAEWSDPAAGIVLKALRTAFPCP